jgi:hypothetical protein
MKWPRYAFAGAAVLAVGCILMQGIRSRSRARAGRTSAGRGSSSRIGKEAEDQAIARAQSEVASGEYDMQG